MLTLNQISINLQHIYKKISQCGCSPSEINLIAVTKQHPVKIIEYCHQLGLLAIGENRAEELDEKANTLESLKDMKTHFIGSIQSRKIKLLPRNLYSFDSLSSLKTAQKLEQWLNLQTRVKPLPVLLQINASAEPQKSGFLAIDSNQVSINEDLTKTIELLANSNHLQLQGIMSMGPTPTNAYTISDSKYQKDAQICFENARKMKQKIEAEFNIRLTRLSLGMSHDFEIALQQGANEIRIGSLLLGNRNF